MYIFTIKCILLQNTFTYSDSHVRKNIKQRTNIKLLTFYANMEYFTITPCNIYNLNYVSKCSKISTFIQSIVQLIPVYNLLIFAMALHLLFININIKSRKTFLNNVLHIQHLNLEIWG